MWEKSMGWLCGGDSTQRRRHQDIPVSDVVGCHRIAEGHYLSPRVSINNLIFVAKRAKELSVEFAVCAANSRIHEVLGHPALLYGPGGALGRRGDVSLREHNIVNEGMRTRLRGSPPLSGVEFEDPLEEVQERASHFPLGVYLGEILGRIASVDQACGKDLLQ